MPEHSSKLIENWQEFKTKIIKVSEITIKKKSKDIACKCLIMQNYKLLMLFFIDVVNIVASVYVCAMYMFIGSMGQNYTNIIFTSTSSTTNS